MGHMGVVNIGGVVTVVSPHSTTVATIADIPGSFVMRVSPRATNRLCTVIRCGG